MKEARNGSSILKGKGIITNMYSRQNEPAVSLFLVNKVDEPANRRRVQRI
jgi:hypothetical protein